MATFDYNCDRTGDQMTISVLGESFDISSTTVEALEARRISTFVFSELLQGLNWHIRGEIEKGRVGFDVIPVDEDIA